MNEVSKILAAWSELRERTTDAVLATVVDVQGSVYRRPGARMLLNGLELTGCVSGGYLESDLLRRAWWLVAKGRPVVKSYETTDDDDTTADFSGGCNGMVDILLEPLTASAEPPYFAVLRDVVERCTTRVLGTVLSSEGASEIMPGDHCWLDEGGHLVWQTCAASPPRLNDAVSLAIVTASRQVESAARSTWRTIGGLRLFLEFIRPPASVTVFGAGRDAVPLVEQCMAQGWRVTVVDPQIAATVKGRFPTAARFVAGDLRRMWTDIGLQKDTMCVIMTHNLHTDFAILETLLATPVPYIGVLGPRARSERMLANFSHIPSPERLFYPVGLDLGAETPEAIALAIVAEMQAVRADRLATSLRAQLSARERVVRSKNGRSERTIRPMFPRASNVGRCK